MVQKPNIQWTCVCMSRIPSRCWSSIAFFPTFPWGIGTSSHLWFVPRTSPSLVKYTSVYMKWANYRLLILPYGLLLSVPWRLWTEFPACNCVVLAVTSSTSIPSIAASYLPCIAGTYKMAHSFNSASRQVDAFSHPSVGDDAVVDTMFCFWSSRLFR